VAPPAGARRIAGAGFFSRSGTACGVVNLTARNRRKRLAG
jgi:hypothetical protein